MAPNTANKRVETQDAQDADAPLEQTLDAYRPHRHEPDRLESIGPDLSVQFAELTDLPILDARSPNEILGYDANGLP